MEHLYWRVEEAHFREDTPLRRAFRLHLANVARAMRAIEWDDSGDGDDSEDEAIRACLGPHAEIAQLVIEANAARDALDAAIGKSRHA